MEFLESFAYLLRATTDDMENIDKLQFLQVFSYLFSNQSSDKLLVNPCTVFCIIKKLEASVLKFQNHQVISSSDFLFIWTTGKLHQI